MCDITGHFIPHLLSENTEIECLLMKLYQLCQSLFNEIPYIKLCEKRIIYSNKFGNQYVSYSFLRFVIKI